MDKKRGRNIIIIAVILYIAYLLYSRLGKNNKEICQETEQQTMNREQCNCMGFAVDNNAVGRIAKQNSDGYVPTMTCMNYDENVDKEEPCPCSKK